MMYALSGMDRPTAGEVSFNGKIITSFNDDKLAAINQPAVVFADEPTGALNRTSSGEVMDELAKINNEGATIMLVTMT